MFTGIIEELGKVASLEKLADGARIKISAKLVTADSGEGDSIAVNGVCLTALDIKSDSFAADVSQETLNRSALGSLKIGSRVNLERAVTPLTRLGGHIVQGHVDAAGEFLQAVRQGDFWTVRVGFPAEMARYLIYKGSIAVDGISLTIAGLKDNYFEIAVIPKTWELTNLSTLKCGDAVNLEVDMIAKYVERILKYSAADDNSSGGVTIEKLSALGYVK
ncbi:MAG: riboflavin synthase [Pyrinomonadaceae bacterium]